MESVQEIREAIEAAVSELVPTHTPRLRFRRAPSDVPLEEMPMSGTADETTRQFRVLPRPATAEGDMNGIDLEMTMPVDLVIRYLTGPSHDADERWRDMAVSDSERLQVQMLRGNQASRWALTYASCVDVQWGGAELGPGEVDGIQIMTCRLDVRYFARACP